MIEGECGLMQAMMDFFGKKPGETTQELAGEFRALTEADKAEIKQALIERGYKIR